MRASGDLHQTHEIQNSTVRLQLIGDMGWNGDAQRQVAASMEARCLEHKPDALIFLGDNIYKEGVDSVDDPKWDTHLLDFYQSRCLQNIPIYAILGNHDYAKNAQAQIDFSHKSNRWHMPFRYYDVAFGDLLSFTAGDGWFPNYCFRELKNCALNFIGQSLEKHRDKPWRIVAAHYPIKSISAASSGHRGGFKGWVHEQFLCGQTVPPTAYVSGHAHHLEHNRLTRCGMDLLISGAGGGSNLYPIQEERLNEVEFAESTYGFLEILANKNAITYSFFDNDAQKIYSHTRNR